MNKLKKKAFIFLTFLTLGIIFSVLSNNLLFCIGLGALGKMIAGSYSWTPSTLRGKTIAGGYSYAPPPAYPKARVICGQYGELNKFNPNVIIS